MQSIWNERSQIRLPIKPTWILNVKEVSTYEIL